MASRNAVLPSPDEYAALTPKPASPVWRAFNDVRLMSTAGYATLLQVAHPTVGHGVHQYSSFTKDPLGRLLRTLDYVHGTVYGGPEMASSIGARVRSMHTTIKGRRDDGRPYNAMEPDAFAWVHATLAAGIFEGSRYLTSPLAMADKQAFWTQWRDVGRLVGVRYRDLPEDVAGFEEYFARVVEEELVWTPAVPEVLAALAITRPPPGIGVPAPIWRLVGVPVARHMTLTTTGLLPPVLRERLGVRWTRADDRIFRSLSWVSRRSGRFARGPLANFGPMYVRRRRKALARGDVARAGSAPARRGAVAT